MPELRRSRTQAASIALRAAALDRRRLRTPQAVLAHLGMVQLDTIAVLARSQELVAHARLGAVERQRIHAAYWGNGTTFEYWAHEACVLPMEAYPLFAFRRREFMGKAGRWGVDPTVVARVRAALATEGPQTATELGGARRESGWWRWSDTKNAVEWMLAKGEVVVTDRRAWKRVYDLADHALPVMTGDGWTDRGGVHGPSDSACVRELLMRSLQLLGIGTLDDLRDVYRLRMKGLPHAEAWSLPDLVQELLEEGTAVAVTVDGEQWYADPTALARTPSTPTSLTTLLSPFDPLVWHRPRLERLFGLRLRIEAYTPKEKRVHGYFAMPVLHAGRIIGLVDPARDGEALVARRVTLHTVDEQGVALALAEAARWVGSTRIVVQEAASAAMARRITAAANAALTPGATPDSRAVPRP